MIWYDNHCRGFAIVALLFIFSVHNGNYHKESHTTLIFISSLSNTVCSINAVLMRLVLPVIYVIIICIGTGIFTTSTPIEAPWTLLWEWIIVGVFRFTIKNCLKNNIKSYPLPRIWALYLFKLIMWIFNFIHLPVKTQEFAIAVFLLVDWERRLLKSSICDQLPFPINRPTLSFLVIMKTQEVPMEDKELGRWEGRKSSFVPLDCA